MNKHIAVAGTGYVGLSLAVLLSQNNHVTAVDILPEKVEKINNQISPIQNPQTGPYGYYRWRFGLFERRACDYRSSHQL